MDEKALIIFDDDCVLCNRSMQWILKRDKQFRFEFASLQSAHAKMLASNFNLDTFDRNTVVFVKNNEYSYRSKAVFSILKTLGGAYSIFRIFNVIPRVILDALYNFVARNRNKLFTNRNYCINFNKYEKHTFYV